MQPTPPFEPKRISQKQRKAEADLIRIYDALASAEYYVNNVTEAILHQENAIRLMKSLPTTKPELLADMHESLAHYLMEDDQWDGAEENLGQAIKLCLQTNRPSNFIKLAENFASLCSIENKRDPSFNFNIQLNKFKKRIQQHKIYREDWELIQKLSRDAFTRGYSKRKPTKKVSKFTLMTLFWEYNKLIDYLKLKQDYVEAIRTSTRILELLDQFRKDDIVSKISALFTVANLKRRVLQTEEARQILVQIEQIFSSLDSTHVSYFIELNYQFGLLEHTVGNLNEAKIHFVKAIGLLRGGANSKSSTMAWTIYRLANTEYDLGNYEDARELLEESLDIFKYNHSDPDTYKAIYQKLAEIELTSDNREKSKDYILQAIEDLEKMFFQDFTSIASFYKRIASMELKDGNVRKAEEYMYKYYENQVIDLATGFHKLVTNYYHRAVLLMKLGYTDYSKQYMDESLNLYMINKLQDPELLMRLYTNLGRHHTKTDEFAKAILFLKRALKIVPSSDIALYSLAQVYEKRNKQLDYRREKILLESLVMINQEKEIDEFLKERILELNKR